MDDNQTWMKSEMGWDLKEPIYNIHLKTKKNIFEIKLENQDKIWNATLRQEGMVSNLNKIWGGEEKKALWKYENIKDFFCFGKVIFANWNP